MAVWPSAATAAMSMFSVAPTRGELEVHVSAAQAVRRRGVQNAVIHVERNAQGLQAHQVHVDLAGADLAAAGHGHAAPRRSAR